MLLDALLDEFADLKERIDRGVRAKIEEEGTAEERKLLEKANKRLETVAEAAEWASMVPLLMVLADQVL